MLSFLFYYNLLLFLCNGPLWNPIEMSLPILLSNSSVNALHEYHFVVHFVNPVIVPTMFAIARVLYIQRLLRSDSTNQLRNW